MPQLLTALASDPGRTVVRLLGEVDVATSPQLAEALTAAVAQGEPLVVVDVTAARFWDVSGLHVLADVTGSLVAAGRDCRVAGATAATRRLVGLADFGHELHVDAA